VPRPFALALVAALALAPLTRAEEKVQIDEPTKKATARALAWIAQQQNSDGSWSDGKYSHNTAVTSFALLAFLSQGHLPGQGTYGPEVAKAARFLMAAARDDGYLVGTRGGNMYCHGMATLALAELFGMTGDEEIKPVLKKAVDLTVKCQNGEGGWRYEPNPRDADISVTIMQVMALRAAKNSGMHVPDKTLQNAIAYIDKCYDPRSGAYRYRPGERAPGFARTAAGVCVLHLTGKYDAKQIATAVQYLESNFDAREHFWYGHYYAAHAMHQVGGKKWEDWYFKINRYLRLKQAEDGSWSGRDSGDRSAPGPVYQTSIGVIILSVPAHYLPIYQR
jgi:prenyltransferase beta subunit